MEHIMQAENRKEEYLSSESQTLPGVILSLLIDRNKGSACTFSKIHQIVTKVTYRGEWQMAVEGQHSTG